MVVNVRQMADFVGDSVAFGFPPPIGAGQRAQRRRLALRGTGKVEPVFVRQPIIARQPVVRMQNGSISRSR